MQGLTVIQDQSMLMFNLCIFQRLLPYIHNHLPCYVPFLCRSRILGSYLYLEREDCPTIDRWDLPQSPQPHPLFFNYRLQELLQKAGPIQFHYEQFADNIHNPTTLPVCTHCNCQPSSTDLPSQQPLSRIQPSHILDSAKLLL